MRAPFVFAQGKEALMRIPADSLVLVADGEKALFLVNRGDAVYPALAVVEHEKEDDPPTSEQGTGKAGRVFKGGARRSAVAETDWHRLQKERFAADLVPVLEKHAGRHGGPLILVAPPAILGELRAALPKALAARILAEIPKDLTKHTVLDIERHLAAADEVYPE
jgi:protein required for attachment to host cells